MEQYGGISCLVKKNSIYIWCWPLKLRDKWWSFNETSASLGFKSRAPFNLYFSTTRPTFTQLLHTFGCGWYTTFTQLLHTRLPPDKHKQHLDSASISPLLVYWGEIWPLFLQDYFHLDTNVTFKWIGEGTGRDSLGQGWGRATFGLLGVRVCVK